MHKIKCPKCNEVFTIDEASYANIQNQVRNKEFNDEVHKKLEQIHSQHNTELSLAEEKTKNKFEKVMLEKQKEIELLKGEIDSQNQLKNIAVSEMEKQMKEKVIEQERLARKYLAKRQIDLEDKVYRAYGILTNAKKVSSEECRKLLSDIKLGTDLGIIRELNDAKVSKLELYTKPGNLQKYLGKKLDAYERDIQRAKVIKQIINS